ncbi:MAG: PTS transporter subunit EIIB [Tolumonas sp.]|uniref:PTS transporter subunit EIIB n=1 Tax=uncultured Tolumonas sp. TaxID=263765 RepID=UPI002A0A6BA3|nr:PTS transporter subunit EIIB [uncultured Tolumonas sp.]MDD2343604.1 PTS transporter subunit EIIB [Tolumonas sp.]MDD2842065.1 PTS transporter subunit EIIB [Tolumonas sp.]
MDAKVVAQQIFEALGGNENIISLVYCATRLRFVLNDDSVVDENKLAQITEVTGTFRTGGQYQIILGMGKVKLAHDELIQLIDSAPQEVAPGSLNPVQKAVKVISDLVSKN